MNIQETSQTNYFQLQVVLGSPLYDDYDDDFDRSAGAVYNDMSAPLRADELSFLDNIITPRKTKNGGRFLGGLLESFLAPFLDIIKNLFGGDTQAFLRAKRAGKI